MKNLVTLLFILISTSYMAIGQNLCGTTLSEEQKTWLRNHQQNPKPPTKAFDEMVHIPIQFHIVGRDDGSGYFPERSVYTMLCKLNDDFWRTNMQFYRHSPFNYLNNSDWYDHDDFGPGYDLISSNNYNNVINIYIVDNPAGNCGYFAPGADGIVINDGCTSDNDATISHEVGHYLALPHTFSGWEGDSAPPNHRRERVLRNSPSANCDSFNAGDGFCDTPADYLSSRWSCPFEGELKDPDDVVLTIDESLIMSYSLNGCGARFSPQQLQAMHEFTADARPYLLNHNPAINQNQLVRPVPVYPNNNSEVPKNNIRLEWTKVEGASYYHLELRSPSAGYKKNYELTSNNLSVSLQSGFTYFWTVSAMGTGNYCAGYVNQYRFLTKEESDLYVTTVNPTLPSCMGEADGSLEVHFNDGSVKYLYNLAAGIHDVIQVNSAGESIAFPVKLPNPDEAAARIQQLANGKMAIRSMNGGQPPYTYKWNGTIEGEEIVDLPGGEHFLQIVDSRGCETMQSFQVIRPIVVVDDISCDADSDSGEIELIEIAGGSEPYEMLLTKNLDPVDDWDELTAGEYVLTIIDADDREVQYEYYIVENQPINAALNIQGNDVSAEVSQGIPPYLMVWSNGVSYEDSVSGLATGDYWVYIQDATGCSTEIPFSILSSGIADASEVGFTLFPNPNASDNVYLNIPADKAVDALQIYNADGRLQQTLNVAAQTSTLNIDVSSYTSGIYFLQLVSGKETSFMKLMIR